MAQRDSDRVIVTGDALGKLREVLFGSGASCVFPPIMGGAALMERDNRGRLPNPLSIGMGNLITTRKARWWLRRGGERFGF